MSGATGKWFKTVTAFVLSAVIAIYTVAGSGLTAVAQADDSHDYPNSVTLEALLNDRSYVVDALTVKDRPEANWGGDTFTKNPHLAGANIDHYMYEDLLDDLDNHPVLKGIVDLYKAKSDWENYPIETLTSAVESRVSFMSCLKLISNTAEHPEQNVLVRTLYKTLGGAFPTEVVLETVQDKKDNDEVWADYPDARLATLENLVDGSDAYNNFKEELNSSSDSRDKDVCSMLNNAEQQCFSKVTETIAPITKSIKAIDGIADDATSGASTGETTKKAKIYDVILNDIFTSEYTSSAGVALHSDLEAKTELDEYAKFVKEYKKGWDHLSDIADLAGTDAERTYIEDYLELLKDVNDQKNQNVSAALKELELGNGWFASTDSFTAKQFAAYYNGVSPDESIDVDLEAVNEKCAKRFVLLDGADKFISKAKAVTGYTKTAIGKYYLIDALARENEYARGVLQRTADTTKGSADSSWTAAVTKYKTLLDIAEDSSEGTRAIVSVLDAALDKFATTAEKKASKAAKKFAREQLVSLGKDAATRASVAKALASVCTVYAVIDTLDDYIVGLQDAAEKIYEIKYLLDVQDYAKAAYNSDKAAYQAESDPDKKEEHAANALADLQFLKQIKLRQIDDAYDTMSSMKDKTLSGLIVKLYDRYVSQYGPDTSLDDIYQRQMDAVLQMMVCPVGGEPFVIPQGKTLTVTEATNVPDCNKETFVGTLTNADGTSSGAIYEMEYLLTNGIQIPSGSTLVLDVGKYGSNKVVKVPEILSTYGTLVVGENCNAQIGYVNGTLYCDSDMRISGSVNGSVIPKSAGVEIEIDGSIDADTFEAQLAGGNGNASILVHGNVTVEDTLKLKNIDMMVEGTCTAGSETAGGIGLAGSVLETKGDLLNNYETWDFAYSAGDANKASKLRIWKDASFPHETVTVDVVMCGDGTASIHGGTTTRERWDVWSEKNVPYTINTVSFDNGGHRYGHRANLTFDTENIRSLNDVEFIDYAFPQGIHVAEDSTIFPNSYYDYGDDSYLDEEYKTTLNDLTFEKNLLVTGSYNCEDTVYVNGNVTVAGGCTGTFVTQGDLTVTDGVRAEILDGSTVGGDLVLGSIDEHSKMNCVVKGDFHVGETGIGYESDVTVEGTLHYGAGASWAESYYDTGRIHAKGDVELHGIPAQGKDVVRMNEIELCGGTLEKPQVVTHDEKSAFGMLHFADGAYASFPNGLDFEWLETDYDAEDVTCNVDSTLTVVGELPYYHGGVQTSGTIVFEDDVNDFSPLYDYSVWQSNSFNNVHFKKDVQVGNDVYVKPEPTSISYNTDGYVSNHGPLGRFSADGTLAVVDGKRLVITKHSPSDYDEEGQLINGEVRTVDVHTLKTKGTGEISISSDIVNFHSIEQTGTEDSIVIYADEANWSGGDIIVNGNTSIGTTLKLRADTVPTVRAIDGSDGSGFCFENFEIDSLGLRMEIPLQVDGKLTFKQKEFTFYGQADLLEGSGIQWAMEDAGQLEVLHFREAAGLDSLISWGDEGRIWNVTSREQVDGHYVYDADLWTGVGSLEDSEFAELFSDPVKVHYVVRNCDYPRHYQKGSALLLETTEDYDEAAEEYVKTFVTTMYKDYYDSEEGPGSLEAFDMLEERAAEDVVLYFEPSTNYADGVDNDPDSAEYSSNLAHASFTMRLSVYPFTGDPVEESDATVWSYDGQELVLGEDFEMCFFDAEGNELESAPSELGTYYAGIRGVTGGLYTGETKAKDRYQFRIAGENDLGFADYDLSPGDFQRTGSSVAPEVEAALTVTMNGEPLTAGEDYEVSYRACNNVTGDYVDMGSEQPVEVGAYQIVVTGTGGFTGSIVCDFNIIDSSDLSYAYIDVPWTYAYTGKPIPKPVVYAANSDELKEGRDFEFHYLAYDEEQNLVEVEREDCAEVGRYCMYATGIEENGYTGETNWFYYDIIDIVAAELPACTYTGKALKPSVELSYEGGELAEGSDYEVIYKNNVNAGEATAVATGINGYGFTIEIPFTIKSKAVKPTVSAKQLVWTGKTLNAKLTVKADGKALKAGAYSVGYSGNRKAVGTCKVKVTLKGNYSGSATTSFDIVPKGTSVKGVKAAKKTLTVNVAKQAKETTGYEVQASLKKNFAGAKTVATKKASATAVKVTKLKPKKKYFVRVRTYKTLGGAKYYSAWSAAKTAKTK